MTARLEQERDNPQASVLLGGSADNYIQLREAGLLEAYQSPELTDVPEAYQDEQGVWNPIYIGTLCFACNTDWFARTGTPMPTCWDDLLSPALAGQIVMATPKSSGTSYTTLATLVQMRGEDKAWAIRESCFGPVTPKVPGSILQLHNDAIVIADEAALSLCGDFL